MASDPVIYSGQEPMQGADGTANANTRVTKYGDQWVQALSLTKDALAQEGRYYCVTNPTIGTTVGFGVSASFSDTAPMFIINNTAPPGPTSPTITLDFLTLFVTVVPASGTSARLVVKTDSVVRVPSAGNSGLLVPQNTNQLYANAAQANVQAGTGGALLTVPASVNGRIVANSVLRNAIPVQYDELFIAFGQELMPTAAPTTATGTGAAGAPPIVIPPSTSAAIHIWFPSNATTGLSAEYALGFWMR